MSKEKAEAEERFKQLDKIAKPLRDDDFIRGLAQDFSENVIKINLENENCLEDITDNLSGIYFFEIRFPNTKHALPHLIEEFGEKWGGFIKATKNKSPLFYPRKAEKTAKQLALKFKNELPENRWVPLYLGKSSNLKKRIQEHTFSPRNKEGRPNKTTLALRLIEKEKILEGMDIKVSYMTFELPRESKETTYFFIEIIEKELREELMPIIGKQ